MPTASFLHRIGTRHQIFSCVIERFREGSFNELINKYPRTMSSNKRVFGQASRRGGPTRYQRQLGSKGSAKNSHSAAQLTEEQERAERRLQMKLKRRAEDEACDERFGFCRYSHNTGDGSRSKRGWIFNLLPTVSAYIYVHVYTAYRIAFPVLLTYYIIHCLDVFITPTKSNSFFLYPFFLYPCRRLRQEAHPLPNPIQFLRQDQNELV